MRIKTNIVKLLAVLVILGSLVAIAAVPAGAVAASIVPNPTSGPVGSGVTITASNFAPLAVLSAKFDGIAVATAPTTVTTLADGSAVFGVAIPTAIAGLHTVTVTDGVSVATAQVTVQPKVVITAPTTKQGPVGTSVTVAGTGFSGAGVTADVTIGGVILIPGVAVDNTGSFTATGVVPTIGAGPQQVSATDGAGNSAYKTPGTPPTGWNNTDSFTVTPTLTLSPGSGLAGSLVNISGSGWTPGDTITMSFGGSAWNKGSPAVQVTVIAGADGTITTASGSNIPIPPASTPGVKAVSGTDQHSRTGATTFTVTARALTLTPVSSGPRGTQLLVTGTNMTPTIVGTPSFIPAGSLKIGNFGLNAAQITIDTQGIISPTTVWIPGSATNAPLGVNTITATDNAGLTATATFTVTQPAITINPATGPRGTSVIVSGTGWLPPSTQINTSVTIGVYPYGQSTGTLSIPEITTTPDATGSFAASITIPNVPAAGTYSIYVRDTNANSAILATFTVPGAGITLSPTSGVALTTITVTGTGFKPYWGITVAIGGYNFPTQVFSDVLGAFTFSGQVPGLQPGATVVSATDGTATATTFFTINQGSPTVASIVTPIASQLVRIWGYSGGAWSMYDPADAAGSNLATLTSGAGYWINVNAACTLVYGGYSYALSTGWNLIGWR